MDITGQIFIREPGARISGKRVVILCGIVAIPDDVEIEDGYQLTCGGTVKEEFYNLVLSRSHKVDRREESKGNTPDGLLVQPIWRV